MNSKQVHKALEDARRRLSRIDVRSELVDWLRRLANQLEDLHGPPTQRPYENVQKHPQAQQYLDIAGVIIVAIDTDRQVTLINRKGSELLGYPEEQIVGRDWFDSFVPEEERDRTLAGFRALMAGEGEAGYFENSVLTATGELRCVAWQNTAIRDDQGTIAGTLSSGEDITQRRILEKERKRFHAVLENTTDYVGIADPEGRILYLNKALRRLLGLREDEDITHKTLADFYWLADSHEQIDEAFATVKRAGAWTGELTWRGQDGRQVSTIVATFAHRDGGTALEYCSMIAHDVSELKRLEGEILALNESLEKRVLERTAHLNATQERLKKEMQRAQQYLDVAGVALIALDREGRVTMINRRGCEILQEKEENILGKNWFDEFLSGEEHDAWWSFFTDVMAGRQENLDDGETKVLTHGNEERLIAWHSSVLRNASGEIIGTLGSGEDVTDRKRAEERLMNSEEQLRVITDSIPVLISQMDRTCHYKFNNAAYEGFFGVSRDQLIGTHIRELIGEESFTTCEPHIEQVLDGQPSVFEMQFTDKEGMTRDATVHLVPDRDTTGEVVGFYAVIADITERRQLEYALRRSQKMEAVGLLASGISHDFNNLLMGIGGCCNVALDRLEKDSPVRIFLDEIRSAASSGASISRQLLDLSRQSKGEVADAPLDALVADTESMLRRMLGADIRLQFDLQSGSRRPALGQGQLKQILLNLVVNARDASPEGGVIDIETRAVELSPEQARVFGGIAPGSYVTLTVRDTGTGMDAATIERIFEPFFTTKEVGKGTGLGLSTVYAIVTQQGGYVDVRSKPNAGTTFTIFLPESTAERAPDAHDEIRQRRGSETVLVVEDDRLVQLALREYLARWGYRVIEASDGDEAVQMAREHHGPIPLLISDMVLPGMPGSKVAKAVLELHPEAKVIFMSAHSPAMLAEAGHLQHGTETLQKPFGEEELLERVSEVLGHSPSQPSVS